MLLFKNPLVCTWGCCLGKSPIAGAQGFCFEEPALLALGAVVPYAQGKRAVEIALSGCGLGVMTTKKSPIARASGFCY